MRLSTNYCMSFCSIPGGRLKMHRAAYKMPPPPAGNKSLLHKLELLQIHLGQIGNAQGTEFVAFDIGLHQDIVGAMPQGETRSVINY